MIRSLMAAFAATALLCACATTAMGDGSPREEKEYRTGSNIPVRDRTAPSQVKTVDPEAIEQARSIGTRSGPIN